jgi:hypothetical protein
MFGLEIHTNVYIAYKDRQLLLFSWNFPRFLTATNIAKISHTRKKPDIWYIDPPTHGILTPLTMVCRPPYPWYNDPPNHGISTHLPMVYRPPLTMVYWPPCPWYIDPLTMVYRPLCFCRNEGGSIYHEGVQNTMTKNLPRGQNTIWKIEPGVIWYFEPHGKLNPVSIYLWYFDPGFNFP